MTLSQFMAKSPLPRFVITLALLVVGGCGGGSSSNSGGGAAGGTKVKGSLKSSTGNLAENAGWITVFTERDTGVSHVGKVGPGSKFEINGLRPSVPMTVVLLNPNYEFKSVLTSPDVTQGQIRQFFTMSGTNIPSLVEDGTVVRFADEGVITWQQDVALDSDFDGVPDGMEDETADSSSLALSTFTEKGPQQHEEEGEGFSLQTEVTDFDGDGKRNEIDADIDGDGIINWFDADIDVDTVINIFDFDANGNNVEDYLEQNSELYYPEGVEYFTVQVIQEVVNGALETYLFFTTKLRVKPDFVLIAGSTTLFEGATASTIDAVTGLESTAAWDLTLADDGLNGDGEKDDLVYGRKILLDSGIVPNPRQVVFLQLQFGRLPTTASYMSFPYMFPEVETAAVTGASTGSNTFTVSGTPFVDSKESANTDKLKLWTWSVILKDADGQKVFGSSQLSADTSSYVLPEGTVPVGTYDANIIIHSNSRIPGLPAWTIKSADFSVTTVN